MPYKINEKVRERKYSFRLEYSHFLYFSVVLNLQKLPKIAKRENRQKLKISERGNLYLGSYDGTMAIYTEVTCNVKYIFLSGILNGIIVFQW